MKQALMSFFNFVRLIDDDKRLSLTNIAVIIVLVKLATAKSPIGSVDIVGLVGVLLNYTAKKIISNNQNGN